METLLVHYTQWSKIHHQNVVIFFFCCFGEKAENLLIQTHRHKTTSVCDYVEM